MSITPKTGRLLASLLAVAGGVVCVWWGLTDHGIYHPDEIYQTLEPAHRLVYGSGLTSWEWRVGARNWTLPAVLSLGFWVARLFGFETSPTHLIPVTVLVCVATAAASLGVFRLARDRGVRPLLAVLAVALFAFSPAALYFGHRPLAEVVSAPFVVWGLALTLNSDVAEGQTGSKPSTLGLSLLGFAVLLRFQNVLFGLAIVGLYWWRGRERAYRRAVDVFAVWGLLYGLIDWVSWGVPFQSAGAYLRAHLLMGLTTEHYAASPPELLVAGLFATCGPVAVVWGLGAVLSTRRAPDLVVVTLAFLVIHQLFPHKQLRFVYPALPLVAALAAVGGEVVVARFEDEAARCAAPVAGLLTVATVGYGLAETPKLTIGDLRQASVLRVEPDRSAHRFRHEVNELLIAAGRRDDLCGLYVRAPWIVKTGGASYLHRDVPIYHRLERPPSREHFNYAIVREKDDEQENNEMPEVVARQGGFVLLRTRRGGCAEEVGYEGRVDRLKGN